MIRILIADDHRMFCQALARYLSDWEDLSVVGHALTCDEVLTQLQTRAIDVLILDLCMPGCGGIELIRQVKERWKDVHVLVMSMYTEKSYVVQALRAGADGYMTKDDPSDQLEFAIRRVARGARYLCAAAAEKMAFGVAKNEGDESNHARLTEREYMIFERLVAGKRGWEIAQELSLSEKTISNHKNHVLRKMNMTNRTELLIYAIRNGLVAMQ